MTVIGVVAHELVAAVTCRTSVGRGEGAVEVVGVLAGVPVVLVGDEPPAQPPAKTSAVRTISAFVPFMAVAFVDVQGEIRLGTPPLGVFPDSCRHRPGRPCSPTDLPITEKLTRVVQMAINFSVIGEKHAGDVRPQWMTTTEALAMACGIGMSTSLSYR